MKKIIATTIIGLMSLGMVSTANAAESLSHADLLKKVRDQERIQQQVNAQRVADFRKQRDRQQQLLADAKARLQAEEDRSEALKAQFDQNEIALTKLEEELRVKQGNLGELFGVVRQAANAMTGDVEASVISAQYPGRANLLKNLTEAEQLPTMDELRNFWLVMLQEMTEQGNSTSFTADVINTEGRTEQQTVKRIGSFNLLTGNNYLYFKDGKINTLQVQPDARVIDVASEYNGTSSGYAGLFLDPSKGAILQLEVLKMGLLERLWKFRGFAGTAVMVLLVIGLLIALERLFTLYIVTGPKVNAQKKSSTPGNNPLGRIMKVYLANKNDNVENLELKLDEAVLKETPKIERGINLIKVIAALGPLLGLLGTVTGMIEVFQSITLHGTGDPKTMADGISQALATTVWGLIAAIPLTFLHAIVAGKSKNIIHVLEEQSTGLMAQHEENNS